MLKSFRTTAILAGVLVLLSLWYWLYEKSWKTKSANREEDHKRVVSLTDPDVGELKFVRMMNAPSEGTELPKGFVPKFETFELKKVDGKWQLTAPIADMADDSAAGGLVSTLLTTKQERTVEETPKDRKPFLLDPPVLRITVAKSGGGGAETVDVGANTPVGYSSYAIAHGQKAVWRISKSLRTTYEKELFALRNKSLVIWTRAELGEVEVHPAGGKPFLLKKEAGEDWSVAQDGVPADKAVWGKSLNAWLDARATAFPDTKGKSLAAFGLAPAKAEITFTKASDKAQLKLLLGKVSEKGKDRFYVKRSDRDTVYEVDREPLTSALYPPAHYHDRVLSKIHRFDVSKIRLERKTDPLEIVKSDKTPWAFGDNHTPPPDSTRVDTLLTRLQDTKVEKYLPGEKKLADGTAVLTIRVFEKKDGPEKEALVLRFGPPNGKLVRGDRSDMATPFLISFDRYEALDMRSKNFLPLKETPAGGVPSAAPIPPKAEHDGHGHEGHDHGAQKDSNG